MDANEHILEEILTFFKENYSEENRKGMSRYGIDIENAFGINLPIFERYRQNAQKKS